MNAALSEAVDDAAAVFTSGRWAAASERIEALLANAGRHDVWWVQLFASLCEQIFIEYASLKDAFDNPQQGDLALLAWRTRSLLELWVWAMYCGKSTSNARRVYEDAGRDIRGIFDAHIKLGTAIALPSEWLDSFSTEKQKLDLQAAEYGIDSLDGVIQEVSRPSTRHQPGRPSHDSPVVSSRAELICLTERSRPT